MTSWLALEERVIAVTGASGGIGIATCSGLTKVGATVVALDLRPSDALPHDVEQVECDVTCSGKVRDVFDEIVASHGRIDGLVNNAGISRPRLLVDYYHPENPIELDNNTFDASVNLNQRGPLNCAQAAGRYMARAGHGVIVNISSEAGVEGSRGQSLYAGTKGALNSYTLSWAKELGPHGVRVVGVAPGINEPSPTGKPEHLAALAYTRGINVEQINEDYSKVIPLARQGRLAEIADLITYLLSDRASYITGTTISVTGGKSRG